MGAPLPPELVKASRAKAQRIPYVFTAGGVLVPHGAVAAEMLKGRRYREGAILAATLAMPRSPGHWRRIHSIGALLVENCDRFTGMDAHTAVKVVQACAGVCCDVYQLGDGLVVKLPQSLAFESMDQGVFNTVYLALCRWIASDIWPDLEPEEIAAMADAMGG